MTSDDSSTPLQQLWHGATGNAYQLKENSEIF